MFPPLNPLAPPWEADDVEHLVENGDRRPAGAGQDADLDLGLLLLSQSADLSRRRLGIPLVNLRVPTGFPCRDVGSRRRFLIRADLLPCRLVLLAQLIHATDLIRRRIIHRRATIEYA